MSTNLLFAVELVESLIVSLLALTLVAVRVVTAKGPRK